MVWLTWTLTYLLAAICYSAGVVVFMREPINFNIYLMVFLAVLLAALFRGWQTRHKEFTALGLIFAANFTVGHLIWTYSGGYLPSVAGHMLLHTMLAVSAIHFTKSKIGAVVALLFVLDAVWGFLAITGVFPTRPWPIFTGWFYGDMIAYTGHLMLIVFGLSCNDGGRRIMNWLNSSRGRANEDYNGMGAGSGLVGACGGRRRTTVFARSNSDTPIRRDSWYNHSDTWKD